MSNTTQLINMLSGSFENYGDNGYVSSWLCDSGCIFSPSVVITLSFSKSFSDVLPGITITWATAYEEWATKFKVTAYHGERVVFYETVENNEVQTVVSGDIRGYDKIVIEILKWSVPNRRARVESVYIGVEKVYSKKDIISYSATHSVDPLSATLPKDEITFELVNLDGAFNPDNPTGAEKYLMERQQIITRYGYKLGESANEADNIEWIPGGVFYLSEWETPQNGVTAAFTARNFTELMTDTYAGKTSGTLAEIAEEAFEQAGLPVMEDGGARWYIDPSMTRIEAPDDVDMSDMSIAETLQLVANAGCCVLFQDRTGKIHIEPLTTNVTDYSIDQFNSYSNSEVSLLKQLKNVDINNGQYTMVVGLKGETQPVSNDFISDDQAPRVAKWVSDFLVNRRTLTGDFRADPRLEPLDIVKNVNQFSTSYVLVTEAGFTYNGAFRGSYAGRGMNSLSGEHFYSGEVYSGEVDA